MRRYAYREEVCYFIKSICQETRLEEALLSEIIFTKNFKRFSVFDTFMRFNRNKTVEIAREKCRKVESDIGLRYGKLYNFYEKPERKFENTVARQINCATFFIISAYACRNQHFIFVILL